MSTSGTVPGVVVTLVQIPELAESNRMAAMPLKGFLSGCFLLLEDSGKAEDQPQSQTAVLSPKLNWFTNYDVQRHEGVFTGVAKMNWILF